MKGGYNGYKNWETWTMGLWIDNIAYWDALDWANSTRDHQMSEHDEDFDGPFVFNHDGLWEKLKNQFVEAGVTENQDGVSFTDEKLDTKELDECIAALIE